MSDCCVHYSAEFITAFTIFGPLEINFPLSFHVTAILPVTHLMPTTAFHHFHTVVSYGSWNKDFSTVRMAAAVYSVTDVTSHVRPRWLNFRISSARKKLVPGIYLFNCDLFSTDVIILQCKSSSFECIVVTNNGYEMVRGRCLRERSEILFRYLLCETERWLMSLWGWWVCLSRFKRGTSQIEMRNFAAAWATLLGLQKN